jgi:hypothetical protein
MILATFAKITQHFLGLAYLMPSSRVAVVLECLADFAAILFPKMGRIASWRLLRLVNLRM